MRKVLPLITALSVWGCGGSAGSDASATGPSTAPVTAQATLSGVVRRGVLTDGIGGATVSAGGRRVTSDASGRYEITGIAPGSTTFGCSLSGYDTVSLFIVLSAGTNARDCSLNETEIYRVRNDAVLIPRGVAKLRGVIVAMGGPVASGFVTGEVMVRESAEADASQQALGSDLRSLARSLGLALLGMGATGLPNAESTDARVFEVLNSVSDASRHPELTGLPLLGFGISSGGPPAAGFVSRNADRAIGLVARVPDQLSALSGATLQIPTVVALAGLDDPAVNTDITTVATSNRSRGGLWAVVVEPNRPHMGSSAANNAAVIAWMSEMVARRLPGNPGEPLLVLAEASGWLGNPSGFDVSLWNAYIGDKRAASWLPSQAAAMAWQSLARPKP